MEQNNLLPFSNAPDLITILILKPEALAEGAILIKEKTALQKKSWQNLRRNYF